ncbi:unnamed protein product [Penicillium salamii]|uniref:Uncharacterized protein n=1 Tax=Penicillium salamii TaxID=1612424 RepID=A0A9W4NJ68_9EURO|nr:unnamed protein product [Penicillium salamii]CAG8104560.1 unnamed protein product [Penicillium salamii]CAG8380149.1 unnamed protein product [Penicillium salamii]CAG8383957.1 unnamed protein product [Penicillium salamii]CAG8384769.1 unnamed protein product [Penicillium salamii]
MPSLTLTNPDMILPFDGERQSQTPSPPQLAYLSNINGRQYDNAPAIPPRQKKNFSRHAWTHDDVNVSRRLSDIGEELSPARSESFDDPSSPAEQGQEDHKENAHSSSSSTISAGSRRASASTETPEASGEVSAVHEVARAQANAVVGAGPATLPASSAVASAAAEGKGPGEEFTSAILSSEAERILENAKKRLNLMEGNLTRARSTTRSSSSPSPSPSNAGFIQPLGKQQPVGGLYRSISKTDPRNSSLRRQSLIASQDTTNNRHSRVHSETNIPSESSMANDPKRMSRSVSAMGASSYSSLHTDDRSFQYAPTRAYLTHRSSISSIKPPIHVQEEEPQVHTQSPISAPESPMESPQGLGISSDDGSKSSPESFSPVYSSYGPPSRAQSQLQVRDLQYQMKGLHIKISSLKVKTQEDNLRRRSLQSLRTPSPLTAADNWYANALELREGQSSRGSNPQREAPGDAAAKARRDSDENISGDRPNPGQNQQQNQPVDYDTQSVDESMYEDAEEGEYDEIDREALDAILREPLDEDLASDTEAFPDMLPQDATPHEMREDAFDYEHFILHSALGNYTQQLRRISTGSNGSVETTRPAYTARHSRTNSAMSDSTVATFATATEGRPDEEDDIDSVMYWDRRFNHELRHGHSHSHSRSHSNSHPSHQPSPIQEVEVEGDRSETPRGSRDSNGATAVNRLSRNLDGRSSSATTGSATPTALASSLVSTVRAASSTPTVGGINDDDTQMLEALFSSLGRVCTDLQAITTSPDADHKVVRVLRRRLDAARRVLDGELDA